MTDVRQGQVFWLDFGEPRGSASADRHLCVVVQNDTFNRSAIAATVVCLINSNLSRANAPGNVLVKKGDGNLPIDKADLVETIGALPVSARQAISEGLHLLFARL